MNRPFDLSIGLAVSLALHLGLLLAVAGTLVSEGTSPAPIFQMGDSSLALTFVTPRQTTPQTPAPPEEQPVALVYMQPDEKTSGTMLTETVPAEEENPAPEGPEEEPASDYANPNAAQRPVGESAGAPSGNSAAQSDADTLSKGIVCQSRLTSYTRPIYPLGARLRGEEGVVTVRVAVMAAGRANRVDVVHSSVYPDLDRAAVTAARYARFIPAQKNGVPIDSDTMLTFRFQLVD